MFNLGFLNVANDNAEWFLVDDCAHGGSRHSEQLNENVDDTFALLFIPRNIESIGEEP